MLQMKGSLIKDTFEGRELTLYIPPSCGAWNMTFPLLFIQDGDYLFESNLEELERKFADDALPELILAGVEPRNRLNEYTPWPAQALVPERPDFEGGGDAYLAFLADRLMPYLENNYYASGAPSQTGILGASLGGLLSLYAGIRRPEVFSRLGLLSPSMWYEGMLPFVRRHASVLAESGARIYMSIGTLEGEGKSTAQKDMLPLARETAEILSLAGTGPDRLRFTVTEGGTHAASWFVQRLPAAVQWLYGAQSR